MSDKISAQIEDTKTEIRQLQNLEKRLIQEHSKLVRKARTRRLIERGALLESFIPETDLLTNEQIKTVLLMAFHTTAVIETLKRVRKTGERRENDERI